MHDLKKVAADLMDTAKAELLNDGECQRMVVFIKQSEAKILRTNMLAIHEQAGWSGPFDTPLLLEAAAGAARLAKADALIVVQQGYTKPVKDLDAVQNYKHGMLASDPDAVEGILVACKTRNHDGDFILIQTLRKNNLGEIEWIEFTDAEGVTDVMINIIPDFND